MKTKIDHSQCSNKECDTFEYCRIQWASRNLTRIIYGSDSSFGIKEINFSLPVDFEVTSNPSEFFTMEEVRKFIMFGYKGDIVNGAKDSLGLFNNSQFLLSNLNDPSLIGEKFSIPTNKASALAKFTKRIMDSISSIDKNAENGYFRGRRL